MSTNPYAPPNASVQDVATQQESPALWNPGAAGGWSLLFSPIFGAIIHMKNWQALGEPEKAKQSKYWAWGSAGYFLVALLFGIFLPESKGLDLGFRVAGLGLLIAWYQMSGKEQSGVIVGKFGSAYPRKGWGLPVLYALLVIVAFFAAVFVIGFAVTMLQGEV